MNLFRNWHETHHGHHDNALPEPQPDWGTSGNLSATVPVAGEVLKEQMPTLVWLAEVGDVAVVTFLNSLVSSSEIDKTTHPLVLQLAELKERMKASIHYHRKDAGGEGLTGAYPIRDIKEGMSHEDHWRLSKDLHEFLEGLTDTAVYHIGASSTPPAAAEPATGEQDPPSLHDYRDLFRIIPLPDVANDFDTDKCFAKYRVAGPNPMPIRGIVKADLLSLVGDRISDAEFNQILGTQDDSVEQAGAAGRLCVTNYKALSATDPVVVIGSSFVTDPIAIFAEPLTGADHIMPVAIQLGQDPVHSELLLANTDDKYRWQMAKTTVQVADCIHHELVSHLAHTHLVMESFSVAIQRNLKDDHAISRLLRPHTEGTNFINNAAATRLITAGGPIDDVFCNSNAIRLRSIQNLATGARLGYDFKGRMPDVELASRGVDRLKVFPYRDDALLIWKAVLHWAEDYVDLYYQDNEAVKADPQLAAWASDLRINASLIDFDVPETKDVLAKTLAMIMFTGSAQHAAVNFPQADEMVFAPAMTGAAWSGLPPKEEGPAEKQQWMSMMPPLDKAATQVGLLNLLGGVRYGVLGEYRSNEFPYPGTLQSIVEPALEKFREELKAIEVEIRHRNESRGYFAYEYLLPTLIPASINI